MQIIRFNLVFIKNIQLIDLRYRKYLKNYIFCLTKLIWELLQVHNCVFWSYYDQNIIICPFHVFLRSTKMKVKLIVSWFWTRTISKIIVLLSFINLDCSPILNRPISPNTNLFVLPNLPPCRFPGYFPVSLLFLIGFRTFAVKFWSETKC